MPGPRETRLSDAKKSTRDINAIFACDVGWFMRAPV
jgi:hypothetical protein